MTPVILSEAKDLHFESLRPPTTRIRAGHQLPQDRKDRKRPGKSTKLKEQQPIFEKIVAALCSTQAPSRPFPASSFSTS